MSDFTKTCKATAAEAWASSAKFADAYSKRNKGKSLGQRAGQSATGFLIFWVPVSIIMFIAFALIEIGIIGFALLLTVLAGIAGAVDSIRER